MARTKKGGTTVTLSLSARSPTICTARITHVSADARIQGASSPHSLALAFRRDIITRSSSCSFSARSPLIHHNHYHLLLLIFRPPLLVVLFGGLNRHHPPRSAHRRSIYIATCRPRIGGFELVET